MGILNKRILTMVVMFVFLLPQLALANNLTGSYRIELVSDSYETINKILNFDNAVLGDQLEGNIRVELLDDVNASFDVKSDLIYHIYCNMINLIVMINQIPFYNFVM